MEVRSDGVGEAGGERGHDVAGGLPGKYCASCNETNWHDCILQFGLDCILAPNKSILYAAINTYLAGTEDRAVRFAICSTLNVSVVSLR
jgi:hypothetical protein